MFVRANKTRLLILRKTKKPNETLVSMLENNKWNYRSGHLEMLLHTERNSRVGDASLSLSPQLLFLTPVDSDRKYHRK